MFFEFLGKVKTSYSSDPDTGTENQVLVQTQNQVLVQTQNQVQRQNF